MLVMKYVLSSMLYAVMFLRLSEAAGSVKIFLYPLPDMAAVAYCIPLTDFPFV